jgi:hypothetical protein
MTDVERLLAAGDENFDEYPLIWDLAARIALQLDPADLSTLLHQSIRRLTVDGALGPLSALLDGVVRHGSTSQVSMIDPLHLLPMFESQRADVREAAFELLSRLDAPLE